MIKELAIVAGQVYLVLLILNNLIVIFRHQQLPVKIRTLIFYLTISLATDLSSRYLFNQASNNLYLLHIYTLLELLAWSYFFYRFFIHEQWVQHKLPWLVGGVALLLISNSIFLEPITGFNSNAKTLVQLILISYAIYYFFSSFGKIDLRQPLPLAATLINFAILLYYSGSLFIFMFSKLLTNQGVASNLQYGFWAINALLLVILHGLILISLWMVASRKTTSS
ncbi:hypothetical protein [Lewinella cohaerens]|uniref:hypothetical protein n=1 Tax=Lewinella cohaerens TaxID=70995 RepID=UPI0003766686|nr:hypothetical protein [Lewinella cohaerens]